MSTTRMEVIAAWAGVIVNAILGTTSIAAVLVAVEALRESRASRELLAQQIADERKRHDENKALERRPFLAFETVPATLDVTLLDLNGILENGDVRQIAGAIMRNAVQHTKPYGGLVNFGRGPAFDVKTTWTIDPAANTRDSIFKPEYNVVHPSPMLILPGQKAALTHVPSFATRDPTTVGRFYNGQVAIEYRDVDLKWHRTNQAFEIHFRPDDPINAKKGTITVTFGELKMMTDWGFGALGVR